MDNNHNQYIDPAAPTEQPPNIPPQPIPQIQVKPQKAWTLIIAWGAYIIAILFFLVMGPGTLFIKYASPYSYLIVHGLAPYILAGLTFATPIILILIGISIYFTYKKFPAKIRTVLILFSGIAIGLLITWLSINNVLRITFIVYTIITGITSITPIILLVIFKKRDKKLLNPINDKVTKSALIISSIILVAELIFCIFQISDFISNYKQENQAKPTTEPTVITFAESNLGKMVDAICHSEYSPVYLASVDTGLFKCEKTSEIYSVTDPHKDKYAASAYWNVASASFLGAIYNETVAKYFPNTLYIYRNYFNADLYTDLILLVEAKSENEVIDKHIDAIYNYIKDINSEYIEEIRVSIFYTDKLDTVKSTIDYILLSGIIDHYGWLPHGNAFKEYYFEPDEKEAALIEIMQTPNLYSSQTRDAIKFHRHISAEIDNGKTITLEQLRTTLQNSFTESISIP